MKRKMKKLRKAFARDDSAENFGISLEILSNLWIFNSCITIPIITSGSTVLTGTGLQHMEDHKFPSPFREKVCVCGLIKLCHKWFAKYLSMSMCVESVKSSFHIRLLCISFEAVLLSRYIYGNRIRTLDYFFSFLSSRLGYLLMGKNCIQVYPPPPFT